MESEIDKNLLFEKVKLVDLAEVAREIFHFGKEYSIWAFQAEMGGGKTTFIKSLCSYLQVSDHVSSPTFALVNEYESPKVGLIYHFDFYRIKNELEAFEIGAEEYFYSGNLCLIEWPEMIPSLLPDSFLKISIVSADKADSRMIKVEKHGKGDVS
ncbi:tRNA (adenosine(37)-N6)-threonylcarbamoyltransferase complex ATPase subunit type 1 TsaE [Marivirga sp. S37H4]|uniref:tRNA threonylcarbamoyladenosine biosynthesis protein TsaE n=1 Tax=Marivirga aurantiaca TaxID=2802615 RepID=A0A934WVV5_9BACT|nr:tRNA (adenosine(37)-N6)-threonylcarbamoyltransferase complex ATPase subunit type 1 TsaE [Marivirga aurantiaca]MBK6263887.1 tRNA (adenosine(37)-N6)-threonylcarbamoyltransferase complex ATPase subunit type 1 TsaE [Marivirga aurantiaca]